MKYVWVLLALLFIENAKAQEITVTNVKVSVKADSAATARERALEQAHMLAFQKLIKDNFPEMTGPLPSQNVMMDMITDFSIDREKTSPTSYTASLTFQFDKAQLQAWLQKAQPASSAPPSFQSPVIKGEPLKLTASYSTLPQWQGIKKALEGSPGVQKVTILSFSPQQATLEVSYGEATEKLQQELLQHDVQLLSQEGEWRISPNLPSH